MMLMTMRPTKDQFNEPLIYKFDTPGAVIFDKRNRAMMFGFETYEALLVGAAGGYSGYGQSDSYIGTYTAYQGGGGGGGSLRLMGTLKSLSAVESLSIGAVGSAGANATNNGQAGNGGTGGSTTFKGHSAYGGAGGKGPKWNTGPAVHKDKYLSPKGEGGAGGGNSAGLGSGGVGGVGGYYYYAVDTGTYTRTVSTSPTVGTFVAGGVSPVVGGGKGGGGGPGDNNGIPGDVPRAGATGNNATDYYSGGGAISGSAGGAGGGADLFAITGVHEYYGHGNTAGKNPSGAIAIKIS